MNGTGCYSDTYIYYSYCNFRDGFTGSIAFTGSTRLTGFLFIYHLSIDTSNMSARKCFTDMAFCGFLKISKITFSETVLTSLVSVYELLYKVQNVLLTWSPGRHSYFIEDFYKVLSFSLTAGREQES